MGSRARKTSSDEDGFIIIEVLVSALILAIVAGAVLTLITATTRGAAVQRDSGVGNDVAQADQARMRMMKLTEISGTERKERTETRNGTVYTIKSERVFVNNKAGAATCATASSKPDYVQLTSTVTSDSMVRPVVLQSVVSPSSGSLDENNGTLTVKTVNALGEPVSGISVTATSSAAGTRTATTGAEGCANFVSVPAGSYEVTYGSTSLVNPKGESKSTEKAELLGGEYKTLPLSYWDRPATIEPEFVYVEPGTGTLRPAPVDSMYVSNATNSVTLPVGTPGGARIKVLSKAVFPFKSPGEYTVFAGYCATNNPGTAGGNAVGLYSAVLAPAAHPAPLQIRVPALEVTVTNASGAIASGAKVTVTDVNSGCKYGGNSIKRTFWTNSAGHLSNEAAVKADPTKAPTEASLPYGIYNICASLKVGTVFQTFSQKEVKVQNFTTTGTVLPVKLASTGGGECP